MTPITRTDRDGLARPLMCCITDLGGARYWVAAYDAADCATLIAGCEGFVIEDEFGPDEVKAREATRGEFCLAKLTDEQGDTLGPGSMAFAFLEMTNPGVIACSEWP